MRQAGPAGEHYDPRTGTYVPDTFKVTRTSRAMRGVGSQDATTVKIGLGKRILDRII